MATKHSCAKRFACSPPSAGGMTASLRLRRLNRSSSASTFSSSNFPRLRAEGGGSSSSSRGGESSSGGKQMDLDKARELFGIPQTASFDEVLKAKKKLTDMKELDGDAASTVEAAYDMLLMDSLKSRQEGRVSKDVQYADVPKAKPVSQVANELLQKLPGNVQVQVSGPGPRGTSGGESAGVMERVGQAATPQNTIFTLLALWVILQAETTPLTFTQDAPGTQIAAAVIAALYFQRKEKGLKLGRAVAITLGGLVLGTLVGTGVEALVRVDIAPFIGIHSPGMVVGEFSVIGVWLSCAFLV